jgi:aldehyde:ferredoxin oxidoreductase
MSEHLSLRGRCRREDALSPPRWLEPLNRGTAKEIPPMDFFGTKVLTAVDMEKMSDDYYDERGWNIEKGIPTRDKLTELGLVWIVRDLEGIGI